MIVVTTPTGAIGRQVLDRVLDRGEDVRVIARDAKRLPSPVRDRVVIVEGSQNDPSVVDRAFDGARAVFWLPPPNLQADDLDEIYAGFARPACDAFARHKVARVVGISALGRGTPMAHRAGLVTASLAMDDLIASSGAGYRALVMPSFMDNMLRQVGSIRERGEFFWPGPADLTAPTCATRDIAEAAAGLLLDPTWEGVGEQAVLGPEDLSPNDLARIMSETLHRPVAFREIGIEDFRASLLAQGASPAIAKGYAAMMAAKRDGLDNAIARTHANSSPTSFKLSKTNCRMQEDDDQYASAPDGDLTR